MSEKNSPFSPVQGPNDYYQPHGLSKPLANAVPLLRQTRYCQRYTQVCHGLLSRELNPAQARICALYTW